MAWIADQFDVHTVYLTRHPISQSMSVIRNKWPHTVHAFLGDPAFIEDYLDDRQLAICHDILKSADPLKIHVLEWVLENLAPHRLIASHKNWLWITYEQFVLDKKKVANALAEYCELPDQNRILRQMARPSRSARLSGGSLAVKSIKRNDLQALTGRWRNEIDAGTERALMLILEQFEIGSYVAGELSAVDPGAIVK